MPIGLDAAQPKCLVVPAALQHLRQETLGLARLPEN
jgi:hypothetical protein